MTPSPPDGPPGGPDHPGPPADDAHRGRARPIDLDGAAGEPVDHGHDESDLTAGDLLGDLLDAIANRASSAPLRPRVKVSPAGLLRGEIDLIKFDVPTFSVAGLVLDRFAVRGERIRIVPGLPPTFVAEPVRFMAVVSQANVDAWTRASHLPFRARLTPEGVITTTGIGGIRVTEVTTDIDVSGRFVRLRPQRLSMLGVSAPLVRLFRGYLPLPPLPRGARAESIEHGDGTVTLKFRIDRFEQKLTPDVTARLTRLLPIHLPGLR